MGRPPRLLTVSQRYTALARIERKAREMASRWGLDHIPAPLRKELRELADMATHLLARTPQD